MVQLVLAVGNRLSERWGTKPSSACAQPQIRALRQAWGRDQPPEAPALVMRPPSPGEAPPPLGSFYWKKGLDPLGRHAAGHSASRGGRCSGRDGPCCHARCRRARQARGCGAPSSGRPCSRGVATSPCHLRRMPSSARSPCLRLLSQGRSRCVGRRAQGSWRRSASATLGTHHASPVMPQPIAGAAGAA